MRSTTLIAMLLILAGCGREEETPAPAATATDSAVAEHQAAETRQVLSSDRIYYDLTRFEWYAHGEPLLHEQAGYQPAGTPVAASLTEMERTGEYEGVEYYRRTGDDQSLYVPVFDGYWLAFRTTHTATRAD